MITDLAQTGREGTCFACSQPRLCNDRDEKKWNVSDQPELIVSHNLSLIPTTVKANESVAGTQRLCIQPFNKYLLTD